MSGIVRNEFTKLGHDAMSCDLMDTEIPGNHFKGDIREVLYEDWDLIIAHPPCDYLSNSGVRWLFSKDKEANRERWINLTRAMQFFYLFHEHAFCGKMCIENPIPHKHAKLPPDKQIIQPWQFGHREMKATCLWLKGLQRLVHTDVVGPPPKDKQERKKWAKVHREPPGPMRKINRSRTYLGIARAMAQQWGTVSVKPALTLFDDYKINTHALPPHN